MQRQPEALAVTSHAVGLGHGHRPLLRLPESSSGHVPGEATGGHQQVGGPAEAVPAEERELGENVSGVLAVASRHAAALLDEVPVHPVGHGVDDVEEGAQGRGRVVDGGNTVGDRDLELGHRHPLGVVGTEPHRPGQPGAELVLLHEALSEALHELLVELLHTGEVAQHLAESRAALLVGAVPTRDGRQRLVLDVIRGQRHAPSMTRAIARIQFAS
jgi:hypothetical protein